MRGWDLQFMWRDQREVAREFGLARKTVRKMLAYPVPPGYQRQKPVLRPKLGPWQDAIDAFLEQDKTRPRRQRHTGSVSLSDYEKSTGTRAATRL
jgi:transposase